MDKFISTVLASPLNAILFIVLVFVISKVLKFGKKVLGILICCGLAYLALTFIL